MLTHNRDEHHLREPAQEPTYQNYKGKTIAFPKDGKAGGTWIAMDEERVLCLLNGAFEKHNHLPPYRLSRGIVLLDAFVFENLNAFSQEYVLEGIEPFTLIEINNNVLTEMRWDGQNTHNKTHEWMPHIWSSATLYPSDIQLKRTAIFHHYLQHRPQLNHERILQFHLHGNTGNPEHNLIMQRPSGVKTLSISQIIKNNTELEFYYLDIQKNTLFKIP